MKKKILILITMILLIVTCGLGYYYLRDALVLKESLQLEINETYNALDGIEKINRGNIDDEYVYILDQEGNVYGCKLTNPELIFLYEAKQKSGLYLPFLFVNYNEKLVALSLIINLTDYQVDSNVLKHFEEIKQKDTNYEINYLL